MKIINLTGHPLPLCKQWPDPTLNARLTAVTPATSRWDCNESVTKWVAVKRWPRLAECDPQPLWWDDAMIEQIKCPLDPAAIFALTIDYPVVRPAIFDLRLICDVDIREILWRAAKCYAEVYAAAGAPEVAEGSMLANPSFPADTGWGVWGHDIGDLVFEGVLVDHKLRTIRLFVGS